MNGAITSNANSYDELSSAINAALDSASQDPAATEQLLGSISGSLASTKTLYEQMKNDLQAAGVSGTALDTIDAAIATLDRLQQAVDSAKTDVSTISTTTADARTKINEELANAKKDITEMNSSLEETLKQQTANLASDLSALKSSSVELSDSLTEISNNLSGTASNLSANMEALQSSLDNTANVLGTIKSNLAKTRDDLKAAISTSDIDEIRKIIGNNPEAIAAFLSAPTVLEKHPVYEMKSNGDTMSAFYSSLSLWIGAIFLVALTSVNPTKRRLEGLKDVKPHQVYLGRYGIFACIAILQGIVLCIGNVFFVGVQCEPLLALSVGMHILRDRLLEYRLHAHDLFWECG